MTTIGTATTEQLSPLKRALLAIDQLQVKLDRVERAGREPVAVVGLGCRFPGDADEPSSFWELLRSGTDATSEVPADRWDVDAFYHPDPDHPGTMSARRAGFLRDVRGFEPQFFGISPREAASMDPQQRLLLEVTWEALEHAGIAPDRLGGTRTGVFVGLTGGDYAQLQLQHAGVDGLDAYYASGVAHSIASGRLSYVLGLQGPSLTLDTACSSSLVAIHLAVQSLRAGECTMALAGGVNLILAPENSITLSKFHMLAPDGRCKAFASSADGFARGEGCGVVVLKLLRHALVDGDRVLAVVRGSAVNQDGASSGLTAPNGPAQESVIRDALANAGVAPADVDYVEAHGTGTELGDPIEVQALAAVYGQGRAPDRPLAIGSVKTNVGHLESVAGVVGLIKVVLSMQHATIPPHLHMTEPSPFIDWASLPVVVPTALTPWPGVAGRRLAGVSAFGFSGTNAHLVVESAPPSARVEPVLDGGDRDDVPHLLVLSGRTEAAARDVASRWAGALAAGDASLAEVCAVGARGRAHLAHRVAVVADSVAALRTKLEAYSSGDAAPAAANGDLARVDPPKVGFVYSGQGSQWVGMGQRLYTAAPAFRDALDRCAAVWDREVAGPGLFDVMWGDAGRLDVTTFTQPALFALEWSLTNLWSSWGVVPSALLGHSVGEFVAAATAGVFSMEDGLRLVAARGRLMGELPAGGVMAAVMAPAGEVEAVLASLPVDLRSAVAVAAVNGVAHTVVSGAAAAVDAVVSTFDGRGVRVSRLAVSHAFHSPLMRSVGQRFGEIAAGIELAVPTRRVVSNVSGAVVGAELASAAYWAEHVVAPVRFAQGIEAMRGLGVDVVVEVGPHPVLVGMVAADGVRGGEVWVGSLRRDRDDREQVLRALAGVHVAGVEVAWDAVAGAGGGARRAVLPATPFHRRAHWLPEGRRRAVRSPPAGNPVLGRRLASPLDVVTFEAEIGIETLPVLADHRVFGVPILPAAAFLEAGLSAAAEVTGSAELRDVLIHQALVVGDEPATMQTIVRPGRGGTSLDIFAQHGGGSWTHHLSARVVATSAVEPAAADADVTDDDIDVTDDDDIDVTDDDVAAIRARCTREVRADDHYAGLRENGLDFGPSLHGVCRIWAGDGEALGEIAVPGGAGTGSYGVHPALLDAAVQVLAAIAGDVEDTYLPLSVERVLRRGPLGATATSHVVLRPAPTGGGVRETLIADVTVRDAAGRPQLRLQGLLLKRADAAALHRIGRGDDGTLFTVTWQHADVPDQPGQTGQTGQTASLAAPGAVVAAAEATVGSLRNRYELDHYQGLFEALDDLSTGYVLAALGDLGVDLMAGARFTPSALPVVPAQRQLLEHLVAMLVDDGVLRRAGDVVVIVRLPVVDRSAARIADLAARYPDGGGELSLTTRCGEQLAAALRGNVDPLQLLFPGGAVDSAEQMYQCSPFARAYGALAGAAVAAAVADRPDGRPLRVLEIGGGTGGTTAHVLPRLPAGATYTFTDISPHFLSRATAKFADVASLDTAVLDIEGDLGAQGFDGRRFDIVVAANVLHATAELRRTFANVGRLLAPGGLLVMTEMVRPERFISITFGLTEGWWRFHDTDLRPTSLLLGRVEWLRFLDEQGFVAPSAVPTPDAGAPAGLGVQAVVVAGAPPVEHDGALPPGRRSWLVLADAGGAGDALAAEVRYRGGEVVVAGADLDPGRPDALRRLVADGPSGGFDVAVHLWGLDAPADADAAVRDRLRRPLGGALHLAQALTAGGSRAAVYFVTRGAQPAGGVAPDPDQAALWGFARSLALEHPELRPMTVDLDPSPVALVGADLLAAILADDGEDQVALRAGSRLVARLSSPAAGVTDAAPTELAFDARGTIDNLTMRPLVRRPPVAGEVEIEVLAAALNFKDVLNVLDMYPGDPGSLGSECAGIVSAVGPGVTDRAVGDAVVALAPGCLRTHLTCDAGLVVAKPAGTSFAEAAGMLVAHVTARFALDHVAHLRAGERVLVHAGAGGVGLAAIGLALGAGAEVFATAGSVRKRALLTALGVGHVYDSRSLDFADQILDDTGGVGVDVVLNSLAGNFVRRSLDVLAPHGRFVEIGKRDLLGEGITDGRSYHVVDWGETARADPALIRSIIGDVVAAAADGTLLRLPLRTYPLADAPAAFRHMAQGRHVGKVVLTMPAATHRPLPAIRPDATYLLTGGLGGLGLLTAQHLAGLGARHVVLMGRRPPSPAADAAIAALREDGVDVRVVQGDVARRADVARALAAIAATEWPLRGVVHAAGALDNGSIGQLAWERVADVLAAKVDGARHLDRATADTPLDLFVAYASIASVLGSPGQANHAAANAALDALAHRRTACGLPTISIDWGAWSEVGAAAALGAVELAGAHGLGVITPTAGLAALDRCLAIGSAQIVVSPIDWPVLLGRYVGGPPPLLAGMAGRATAVSPVAAVDPVAGEVVRRRLAAAPLERRPALLLDLVRNQTAHVLALAITDVGDTMPLSDLGLDSLMAVELRNVLGTLLALDQPLPATLVFDHPSVAAIATHLATVLAPVLGLVNTPVITAGRQAETTGGEPASGRSEPVPAPLGASLVSSMLDDMDHLSDDEIDAMLSRRSAP